MIRAVLISVFFALLASALSAASSETYSSERLSARLITAQEDIAPGTKTLSAALEVTLEGNWHAYWRSPGEVGLPPEIDWSGSSNLESAEIAYPAPTRFRAFGIENYGYKTAVTFPLTLSLAEDGGATALSASVFLLVCDTLCVPEEFTLSLELPAADGAARLNPATAQVIGDAAALLPQSFNQPAQVHFNDGELSVALPTIGGVTTAQIFPEGKGLSVGAPDIRLGNNGQTVWAQFPVLKGEMPPERITLASDIGDFEFQTVVSETALPPPYTLPDAGAERSFGALLTTLVIAFVGGLILNVMPCVLPVLSIKLASAVSAVDRSHAEIRTGFLVSALGVMAFVWVLAAATLVAQAVGLSVGWGLQFQNPYFLTLMVAILALFAANTFGLFEITLPSGLMTRMDSESGKSGLVGDFASGAFAAMLATPCSAPFLGTAVAFALTGAPSDVVLIFSALGLGLALPYVLVAAFPSTLSALPKPGRWMLGVKWLLGLMLAATAAWLATVLAGVAGGLVAQISLALIGLAVLALWLGQRFAASPRITAASLVLLGALLAPALTPAPSAPVSTATALGWVPLDQGQIARSVAQGNVVFVDITADWCLTCKANKSLVLDRETVHTALSDEDVITMQGDWTRPDEAISAFLARHERFGIPFNAVYGPAAPEGIILSEVLTQAQVLDALAEAGSL